MDEWIAGWTMGRFATTVPLYEELRPPYRRRDPRLFVQFRR